MCIVETGKRLPARQTKRDKQIFKKESEVDELVKGLPVIPEQYQPKITLVNKKPILPSEKELKENSRSKSAKLRIIERV